MLRSDHAFLSYDLPAINISLIGTSKCCQARLDVTAKVDIVFKFIAGWSACLLLSQVVRAWVAIGKCKDLWRNLLDRVSIILLYLCVLWSICIVSSASHGFSLAGCFARAQTGFFISNNGFAKRRGSSWPSLLMGQ